jgi:hypothetical protein
MGIQKSPSVRKKRSPCAQLNVHCPSLIFISLLAWGALLHQADDSKTDRRAIDNTSQANETGYFPLPPLPAISLSLYHSF